MFKLGDVVYFKADPDKTGAVINVIVEGKENRYEVFHDGNTTTYYESQLLPQNTDITEVESISLGTFHARLTALHLCHPSISNLYSLHAARIETIPYQFRPVLKFIRSDRPRLLIADSVGVGKTIEAGLILREMQSRREVRRVLIVCPRPLVTERKWQWEMRRFDERFEHLDGDSLRFCVSETDLEGVWPERYDKAILPFSLINETFLFGAGPYKGLLQLDPAPQFDLVIVDEAHHIRNMDTLRHQAVRFLCDNADAVLFLTATPIQLGDKDLYVLLNTLRPDIIIDEATYETITQPNVYINKAAQIVRQGTDGWPEAAKAALDTVASTRWGRKIFQEDPQFQEVYDSLGSMEANRSARIKAIHGIENLHSLSSLMNRTLRRDIGEFTQRKSRTVSIKLTKKQTELHNAVLEAQGAIYSSLHGESAVKFLLTTIRRQAASCIYGLKPLLRGIMSRRLDELEWTEIADLSDTAVSPQDAGESIREMVGKVLSLAEKIDVDTRKDPKFLALQQIIDEKIAMPNNKVMLFSSFRHTLAYIERGLRDAGYRVGLIHGGVEDKDRIALRSRFEMDRNAREAVDILLFSEVGCEGLDYQFCDCLVNYDLPWNPMRIDQRIGRLDRWGQKSKVVLIYNFITPGTIDADIYERCLMRIGVFERALGANEIILGKINTELGKVAEDFSLSVVERQSRLDQIADNNIRLIREQESLEDRQTELFGLAVSTDQFKEDIAHASNYWISPAALERLIKHYLVEVTGSKTSPLVGDGSKMSLQLSGKARETLLRDFTALKDGTSLVAREWQKWLKGSERSLMVTFDSGYSQRDRECNFITPVHPLAVQAAQAMLKTPKSVPATGLEFVSRDVSPGEYPFGIYRWQYYGIRNDVEFQPITSEPELTEQFFKMIPTAVEVQLERPPNYKTILQELENMHHSLWSDARAAHVERTIRLAKFRGSSLETSHKTRMMALDSQLASAGHERIRIMKNAQKANAQNDYGRRRKEIDEAITKADITAEMVGVGVIRVKGVSDGERL